MLIRILDSAHLYLTVVLLQLSALFFREVFLPDCILLFQAFKNMLIVPPGSGIVHQVNLEYLARVCFQENGNFFLLITKQRRRKVV